MLDDDLPLHHFVFICIDELGQTEWENDTEKLERNRDKKPLLKLTPSLYLGGGREGLLFMQS